MKQIICFTESLAGGGAEHQIILLAGLLKDQDYDVVLVTYADVPDHYNVPEGVSRKVIAPRKKSFRKLLSIFFFFLKTKADCVISYRKMSNIRMLIPMFFRRKPIKVICSERNFTMGKPDLARRVMTRVLYRKADFIVPNSTSQTEYMKSENPATAHKLRTIYNYTDIQHFGLSQMPQVSSPIKIAIFARYSSQKNPLRFAKAMAQLKAKKQCQFVVDWYGNQSGNINGFNGDYLAIKDCVDRLGIGDILRLQPSVKDPSVLMGYYHAVCLPSLYEGFSNSIAEAISSGKPMLVSDVSDNSIMVHDGENGFLFDPKDIDSICQAFTKFLALSSKEMVRMGKESRKIAQALFDKEKFVQQYVALIEA